MKISVTQDHINAGKKENWQKCPVALAIIEQIGLPMQISVFGSYVRLDGIAHSLPREVDIFVSNFDGSRPVKPFDFELEYSR